jgi:hypothetical protein
VDLMWQLHDYNCHLMDRRADGNAAVLVLASLVSAHHAPCTEHTLLAPGCHWHRAERSRMHAT